MSETTLDYIYQVDQYMSEAKLDYSDRAWQLYIQNDIKQKYCVN